MAIGAWNKAEEYLNKAKGYLVPGQEEKLKVAINNFQNIITKIRDKGEMPKGIKPGEVVKVKASQIAGGK